MTTETSTKIIGLFAKQIGYASHQNAVPVIRELRLTHQGEKDLKNLRLELTSDPPVFEPRAWVLDQFRVGQTLDIEDRQVKLNASLLAGLDESLVAQISLCLLADDQPVSTSTYDIEVLAKNEWGGHINMPDLLAAFITPNDPAVDRLLRAASEILRKAGKDGAIDGYGSQSRTRVWEIVSAIWSAVCALRLSYALPPASFENQGQKVRMPSAILDVKVATCLDSTLLFCAALEQAGLNPLVILTKGHAFTGVWLQPQEFSTLMTDDVSSVRNRMDLKELVAFETTLVTHTPPASFSQAVDTAARQLVEQKFQMALDVRRARMQKVRPLALTSASSTGSDDAMDEQGGTSSPDAFEEAPALPDFDVEVPEEQAQGARGKLIHWQRKLLDLTTRNRLLNLPKGSSVIRMVCPQPAQLEDMLASGKSMRIVALPDLKASGRDEAIHARQNHESLVREYAKAAQDRGEVLAPLDKIKLDAALTDLYRKSRSDLEEGGANTLFLALGFLKWKKSATDGKEFFAPLLLLPIRLDRRSALSTITMTLRDEEARFNMTLLELLRQDFDLTIPALEKELPTDDNGLDIEAIWNHVRRAIRDVPSFEVVADVAMTTFSFAKYLMWKDLADRSASLLESDLVRQLLERTEETLDPEHPAGDLVGGFIDPAELDRTLSPADLVIPLPADSSQIAAVVASGSGRHFVMDGPPGTGKSQTIANMIAHNLALGRRVLFVAEKMAALNVVHRRLEQKGLGEFCLELHSNKTSKSSVLKQLERAWDVRDGFSKDQWMQESSRLAALRDRLNKIVEVLHARRPNGLSIYQAIGRTLHGQTDNPLDLVWPRNTVHDMPMMERMRDAARRLGLNFPAIQSVAQSFNMIRKGTWTNAWQTDLVRQSLVLNEQAVELESTIASLQTQVPLHGVTQSLQDITQRAALFDAIQSTYGHDLSGLIGPGVNKIVAAGVRAIAVIEKYRATGAELSISYGSATHDQQNSGQVQIEPRGTNLIDGIDIHAIETEYLQAKGKFWVLSSMAIKGVQKKLALQARSDQMPDLDRDIPRIKAMKGMALELATMREELGSLSSWRGLQTDITRLSEALRVAKRLHEQMSVYARSLDELEVLNASVQKIVVDANSLLAPDAPLGLELLALQSQYQAFVLSANAFADLCGSPMKPHTTLAEIRNTTFAILTSPSALKPWCDWWRVRDEATSLGLTPLVDALTCDQLSPDSVVEAFEKGYARWFATDTIDQEPVLREFVAAEYVNDIERFRQLDDELSALSVRYIRSQLCQQIPSRNSVGKAGPFAVLRHELQKSRRHKPVRQLAIEMGDAITKLAPCMLMSPLSVSQYLPGDFALFDLVIFDEASQIAPWDAVGVIARGKQVVIAGDPRQMPPTSFFDRGSDSVEDDTESDMESILEECLASGVPSFSLDWHYRSRHESLITFSNHRYYDAKLVTFPAPEVRPSAVSLKRVNGVYAKGAGQQNQIEAKAIVQEIVSRLKAPGYAASPYSMGVITLNISQQQLISDLLDAERRSHRDIEPYFQEDQPEPVIVKNLETMQGDERDLIILSIGYGPTEPESNTMSMNFGPLNREGGWRRLNVAITRSRREMLVYASFDPSMIDLNRTNARAVRDLKHFMEFAKDGPKAISQAVMGSVGGYDSLFEQAVAHELRQLGWEVIPQIGVSRFRIDLGIVHPDRPGDYLVGVECDGATYHSAATARDRDKVRAAILEGLGWKLLRVWSTDWWFNKQAALDKLHQAIQSALDESRANAIVESTDSDEAGDGYGAVGADHERTEGSFEPEQTSDSADQEKPAFETDASGNIHPASDPAAYTDKVSSDDHQGTGQPVTEHGDSVARSREAEPMIAGASFPMSLSGQKTLDGDRSVESSQEARGDSVIPVRDQSQGSEIQVPMTRTYAIADLDAFQGQIDPGRFHEASYTDVLRDMVSKVVECEAPIAEELLVNRIARAHGFMRSGRLIRERVLALVAERFHFEPELSGKRFVWQSVDEIKGWNIFRAPGPEGDPRSLDEIPIEEIAVAIRCFDSDDIVTEIARAFGNRRLTGPGRARIEAALALIRGRGGTQLIEGHST